jgi:hypothetical protein
LAFPTAARRDEHIVLHRKTSYKCYFCPDNTHFLSAKLCSEHARRDHGAVLTARKGYVAEEDEEESSGSDDEDEEEPRGSEDEAEAEEESGSADEDAEPEND